MGVEIASDYRPAGYAQFATFHPTFLYEMLWNLAAAVLLVWLDRRFRLGHGKVFALYVMLYCAGRFWIEALRIDTVNEIGGFRLNNYTALIGFVVALVWLIWLIRNRPGREEIVEGIGLSVESVAEGTTTETSSAADVVEADELAERVEGRRRRPGIAPEDSHRSRVRSSFLRSPAGANRRSQSNFTFHDHGCVRYPLHQLWANVVLQALLRARSSRSRAAQP